MGGMEQKMRKGGDGRWRSSQSLHGGCSSPPPRWQTHETAFIVRMEKVEMDVCGCCLCVCVCVCVCVSVRVYRCQRPYRTLSRARECCVYVCEEKVERDVFFLCVCVCVCVCVSVC